MPEIIKDGEKKASYLTASSTERTLYLALGFIISKVFLSKFTRGQKGCREHINHNSMDTACSCLYRNGAAFIKAIRARVFSRHVSTRWTNTL